MFIFVEFFRFVGEQIGSEVLVFGPAGPDIEPGRCTFLSILTFRFFYRDLSAIFAEVVRRDYLVILGYHSKCNFYM